MDIDPQSGLKVKACSRCKVEKDYDQFYKNSRNKNGIDNHCKQCDKTKGRKYYKENSAKVLSRTNARKVANPAKTAEQNAAWHQKNKVRRMAEAAIRRKNDPQRHRAYAKKYELANPEKSLERNRRRRQTAKGRLENAIRAGFHKGITKGSKAGKKTFDLLGYTPSDLMKHIEALFVDGMSWENYGEWHVDHINPLCVHSYTTPYDIDFKRAWALTNLQPLWGIQNLIKGGRVGLPFQPSLALAL